ncbi:alanine racemase [Bacteroidota bacterium]
MKLNLTRPTLLIDEKKCLQNIKTMLNKARKNNVIFRPHFKSHQSYEIGNWFKKYGVNKITVSSVKMASYFANHGWDDITIAFPVNIPEVRLINNLAKKTNLNLLIESIDVISYLDKQITNPVGIYIKVDTGYHRAGIDYSHTSKIKEIIKKLKISKYLSIKGLLTHSGHTYKAKSVGEITSIYLDTVYKLQMLRNNLHQAEKINISVGDTPSMSVIEKFDGIDEIRPGNFVFYDLMQNILGVCSSDQIAVALASPIVSKNKERMELIIYGGAIHLSRESLIDEHGNPFYGCLVELRDKDWGAPHYDCYVKSISQEHGIVKVSEDLFEKLKLGDFIGILPVHSCLTVNLMKEYITLEGNKISVMK